MDCSTMVNVLACVLLVLLSNAMLPGQCQGVGCSDCCYVDCGTKLFSCNAGCGSSAFQCLVSCFGKCPNGTSMAIPSLFPPEISGAGIGRDKVEAVAITTSSLPTSSSDDNKNTWGSFQFLQDSATGVTHVKGIIAGLTPGLHDLHVIASSDSNNGCSSAGAHFNPLNKGNGLKSYQIRQASYLGSITAGPDGFAEMSIEDKHISLSGPRSILGRTIVVHADVDDSGRGGNDFSSITRNAGGMVGCGIIRPLLLF